MSNSRPDYILSDPGNYRRVKHLSHDHISPSDIEAAYRPVVPPSTYTERWTPGEHFHAHACPDCGGGWCCETPDCKFPESAKCLECWAREAVAPLPGRLFVAVSLLAGALVLAAFAIAVLG